MTLRALRAGDGPRIHELMRVGFPEEEELLGTRPDGIETTVRRLFRWDLRLLLGALGLVGRAPFRFLGLEEDGRLVATTLLTFAPSAGHVSLVMVDPAYRRRGFARRLLEQAREATRRRGRPHLVLDVLEANVPARTLYASLGYRLLRASSYFVHDRLATVAAPSAGASGIRPFARGDAAPLAAIADRRLSPEVRSVLPVRASALRGAGTTNPLFSSEGAAWVFDGGRGPEGLVSATISGVTEASHLGTPIVGEELPVESATALVETALAWASSRGSSRIVAQVADDDRRAREALERAGFRRALGVLTLVRASS